MESLQTKYGGSRFVAGLDLIRHYPTAVGVAGDNQSCYKLWLLLSMPSKPGNKENCKCKICSLQGYTSCLED